ncbi:MAG: hypothetical protein WDM88_12810 [Galbitalea sp.]
MFDSLVDRSLLQRSRGRFRALETVREYGIERLAEQGELVDARTSQARFMARRAGEMDTLLRGSGSWRPSPGSTTRKTTSRARSAT